MGTHEVISCFPQESHLTALCRILHGHLLREQMIKVRRERETSHLVGGNFF